MPSKALILTASEGHKSIAQAIADIIGQNNHWQSKTINIFDQSKLKSATGFYKSLYRYAPSLFRIPFQIGQNIHIRIEIRRLLRRYLNSQVLGEIKKYQPDTVISTYFGYNPSLAGITPKGIKTINVLANPWTIHPLELEPKMDLTMAYDGKAQKICQKMGLPPEKIAVSGWFVRKKFYDQDLNSDDLRVKLGLKPRVFTLLICSGSEGSNAILKILPAIASVKTPLQIVVITGNNPLLFHSINFAIRNLPFFRKKNLNIKIIKFTQAIADYMAAADLVVGKAGPNMVFETTAVGRPFFAICHISGQEDGNLDIIKEKKLGFVQEDAGKAGKLLKKIIQNPKMLKPFEKPIQKEKLANQKAASVLLEALK